MLFLFPFANRFFCRWQNQVPLHEVAHEFPVSLRTVQRLFARFEQHGAEGLTPDYHAGHCPFQTDPQLVQDLCRLRREHPLWGAEMLRLELKDHYERLPCARTLQRHLRKADLQPAPAGRPPRPYQRLTRAQRPHQGWQTDASEELPLRKGSVCWLRVVDECSGAFLKTLVFPQARWNDVDRFAIQEGLRQVFGQWGRPEQLRVDNGYPWNSTGDFPPEMALWLIGLGIDLDWIPPGCPQQNGVVERAQGTGQNWAESHTCDHHDELQTRCDVLDRRQREEYPYRERRSRWEVYPELKHSERPYSLRWEQRHWDLSRVLGHLANKVVSRQVDCGGSISLYHWTRYVGKPHIGKQVYVWLDPTGPTWVIADAEGRQLRTHAAEELTAQSIRSLSVGCRKGKRR